MEPTPDATGHGGWSRFLDVVGQLATWGVWGVMTVVLLVYVRQYTRNIPYWDDFGMVPVMTGTEPVSLGWAWSQHNEHRPLISRLIMAGLTRFVANDFRAARYANVVLLSAMAAAMLRLVRRLRGSASLTDVVLPLAILNVAQVESLMIGFAMNLIVTSLLAIAAIVAAGLANRSDGRISAVGLGAILVLLPLSGGSGLPMLPPLALWLAGYLAWGWRSGRTPGIATRAVGVALLAAAAAITVLYFRGYVRPAHHPLPPSAASAVSAMLIYLSLAVYPHLSWYWWPASAIVVLLVAATLGLLAIASARSPGERPRALAMMAVLLAMLCVAGAVGISRAGLGAALILASRYVTLAIPMLCILYVAWLQYGGTLARRVVHGLLLALIGLAMPDAYRFSQGYASTAHAAQRRVEHALLARVPAAQILSRSAPAICPDPAWAHNCFRMLKAARIGAFVRYQDGEVASAPAPGGAEAVRR